MVADPLHQWMSVEEYLKLDRTALDVRYEYIDGRVRAMVGGSMAHMRIAASIFALLDEQLGEQGPCHAYTSEARVQVSESRYVYPDATVSCDVADWQAENDMVR
ncbi:MAG: Uma2 family endonuclease, partial [Chloroflexi bacterium]|nr:Uma2 family endonuclease [Chloroflexota bacterium]